MIRAFYSGTAGLFAHQNAVDVAANNIANVNTAGYKQRDTDFSSLLYSSLNNTVPITANSDRLEVGNGSAATKITVDDSTGAPEKTGRSLDFCIEGGGYFQLQDGGGNRTFTRSGSFEAVNAGGVEYLADSSGRFVLGADSRRIALTADGLSEAPGVFTVQNPQFLQANGGSIFTATPQAGAVTASTVAPKQGYMESSNVNMAGEMSSLLMLQRSFSMDSKVVQTADDIENMANQLRG